MKRQRITVEKNDQCDVELEIRIRQDEGWYEYIPVSGDTIAVHIDNAEGETVRSFSVTAPEGNNERIKVSMPTDLEAGTYTYDVILTYADTSEKCTVCRDNILIIREDAQHEELL